MYESLKEFGYNLSYARLLLKLPRFFKLKLVFILWTSFFQTILCSFIHLPPRMPIVDEKAPSEISFDAMVEELKGLTADTACVFNCQVSSLHHHAQHVTTPRKNYQHVPQQLPTYNNTFLQGLTSQQLNTTHNISQFLTTSFNSSKLLHHLTITHNSLQHPTTPHNTPTTPHNTS